MRISFFLVLLLVASACGNNNDSTTLQVDNKPMDAVVEPNAVDVSASQSARLNQWFADKFEESLQRSPMAMTGLGRKDRYEELDDFSDESLEKEMQWREQTVVDLRNNFEYESLSESDKLSYDIWVYQSELQKKLSPFRNHEYLFSQMRGMHTYLPTFLINFHKVDTAGDMEAYIKRIIEIKRVINQLLVRAVQAAKDGVRPPRFAYDIVLEQSKALLSGYPFNEQSEQQSSLWLDAKDKISSLQKSQVIGKQQAEELVTAVEKALTNEFESAYQKLISWLENDRVNSDIQAQGVSALPNGDEYYRARLFAMTTLDITADEIHQLGLDEVARIKTEMETIKESVGFSGELKDFFEFVKSDKQFLYPNNDEGRSAYLEDSRKFISAIEKKLPEYFGVLPKAGLVVKRVESYREEDGAPQHYMEGTPDGSRPGVYYAHLSDMNAMPKNEMEAIAYHEGIPGHHMQIAIMQELDDVPMFRTRAFFTSYVEGWALYAELLAGEMGGYKNPYSNFGRLVSEMWRAIRLVVDTGIHSKEWSQQRAVDFFRDNSPISEGQIAAEVRRYFVLPGQATAYKLGMLKIIELREKSQQALGDQFDIRRFHDVVLTNGALPLPLLEKRIDAWIADNQP